MAKRVDEDAIYERVTFNYLYLLNSGDDISPKDIRNDLLNLLSAEIELENAGLNKDDKFRKPKVLPPVIVALILLHLYNIKRITWGDDEGELFIYQTSGEKEGIYINDELVLKGIIAEFSFRANIQFMREVIAYLYVKAPVVQVNSDPDLIAVNNGIFNYKTKELMAFTPDIIFTSKSAIDYNPNALNVVIHNDDDDTDWDVESWMNDLSYDQNIVKLLWELIGAAIRPYVSWEKVACLYYELGNNGKGTLCQLIRNVCGSDNVMSMAFDEFSEDFALESLMHMSSIITDENTTGLYIKATAALKAIITNDVFMVNRKFKKSVKMRFNGVMIQCINSLPKFGDKSESLYRRLLIIPFDKSFTGIQRKYIKSDYIQRREVLEYVLYKVLNMNYYEFDIPVRCQAELDEYKTYNDPIRDFLSEMITEFTWDLVPYSFLYDLYKSWSARNYPNSTPKNKRSFVNDVKNILLTFRGWKVNTDSVPTRGLMDAHEPLIMQYDLKEWKSNYKGTDEKKICNFARKSAYKGITRTISNQGA